MIEFTQQEISDFLSYARSIRKIELHQLEDSIINHPQYVDEVGTYYVKLLSIARVKSKLADEVEAQVESEIRKDPTRFGLGEKVTEKSVSMAVILDDRVKKAKHAAIEAQLNADEAKILFGAIDDKKEMMRHLVYMTAMSHKANKDEAIVPGVDDIDVAGIIRARKESSRNG